MTSLASLLIALLEGALLGCTFFYILWLSAQRIMGSTLSITWFIGSWIARMALAIGGFYWVSKGNWQLLIACLCGFIVGRYLISRLVNANTKNHQAPPNASTESDAGAKHAP